MNRLLLSAGTLMMGIGIGVLGVLAYVTVNTDPIAVISPDPVDTQPTVAAKMEPVPVPMSSNPVVGTSSEGRVVTTENPEPRRQANSGWSPPVRTTGTDPRLEPSIMELRQRAREARLAEDSRGY